MRLHRSDSLRRLLLARSCSYTKKLIARRAISLLCIKQLVTLTVGKVSYNIRDPLFVEDVAP
jgi:hypothetical protein